MEQQFVSLEERFMTGNMVRSYAQCLFRIKSAFVEAIYEFTTEHQTGKKKKKRKWKGEGP